MKKVGRLASGDIVCDRHESHVHKGISEELLKTALTQVKSEERNFFIREVSFSKPVGKTICVKTDESDEITWAKRPGRDGYTRFVKNRDPAPCSTVTVICKRIDHRLYVLISAYVGKKAEPEPWDRNATEQSTEFWNNHALIWGEEDVLSGTETTSCPW